jgi:hypothetical protein
MVIFDVGGGSALRAAGAPSLRDCDGMELEVLAPRG